MSGEHPIKAVCTVLEVSRSGYYAWLNRPCSTRAAAESSLRVKIRALHAASRGTYGSPRIKLDLDRPGQRVGRHRVARVMREAGLQGRTKRRYRVVTTDSRHTEPIAPNRLAGDDVLDPDVLIEGFPVRGPGWIDVIDVRAQWETMKSLLLVAAALGAFAGLAGAAPLHEVAVKDIDGRNVKLDAYRGKVLLIVNVASECGFTPQYTGLQALFTKYQEGGFVVLGFPCNQFGEQEPGTAAEIKKFCSATYRVTFPLFEKIEVNGPGRSPLYDVLAGKASPVPGNIKWNFTKFLVGRDGTVLKRFDSSTEPDAPELVSAVEKALAAK